MANLIRSFGRHFLESGRGILRICVSVLIAIAVLTLTTSAPAGASKPRIGKPGAPTAVTAIAGNMGAAVSWTAPASDGGSPITGYTVKASGGHVCTTHGAISCIVTGLTNGHKYSISVRASNAKHTGKPSAKIQVIPSSSRNCFYLGPYANLQGCILSNSNVQGDGTNLSNLNLSYANLTDADLSGATLTGDDLMGTILTGADLELVTSGGVTGEPAPTSPYSNLRGYLVGPEVNLSSVDLSGANLSGIDLSGANLGDANLRSANLSGTDLDGVILFHTISGGITGTPSRLPMNTLIIDGYLIGPYVSLGGANLSGVDLSTLSSVDLYQVSSGRITGTPSALPLDYFIFNGYLMGPGVDLTGATLSGSLSGVDLSGATLVFADFVDANLSGANLSGADFFETSWTNTICPDGTNSNNDAATCINNLTP